MFDVVLNRDDRHPRPSTARRIAACVLRCSDTHQAHNMRKNLSQRSFSFKMKVNHLLTWPLLAFNLSLTSSLVNPLSGNRLSCLSCPSSNFVRSGVSGDTAVVANCRRLQCRPLNAAVSTSLPSDGNSGGVITEETTAVDKKRQIKKERLKKIRSIGGPLAFDTKYGALNPFGIYWLLVSSSLGLVWFTLLQCCRLFYWVTGNRFDKSRRIPIFFGHVWGTLLMRLSRSYPEMENREVLNDLFQK